ncbi:hypothetical protein [Providencia rettgeri]|jgi:vacuolar-type H+-ATPase subunit I/STV1|uniref:hypothetical protein n=1 Tax=Providencia rettgeri TaxID=587 RepID=UPI00236140B2|nr:hypothetical protein [Providencia rettgeri]MDR2226385.1 hypothetical protein [Providencia sp.]
MKMESINIKGEFDKFINIIRETKNSFYTGKRAYFVEKLAQLEAIKTEFDTIDLSDESNFFNYKIKSHRPVYEYLEVISSYDSEKEKMLSIIKQMDEKLASYANHLDDTKKISSIAEQLDIIKNDFLVNSKSNLTDKARLGNYLMEFEQVSDINITIPTEYDRLIESMISFQSGNIFEYIDINCTTKITTKNMSTNNIIYTNEYRC